jgi:hypothetical protein
MTHAELVQAAVAQLKRWRCLPIISEMHCANTYGEIPDAIGWLSRASILIECKTSRADFLRDREKLFRQEPAFGMGDIRFYFTNPGVVLYSHDLPEGWGCYEVIDGKPKWLQGLRYSNACKIPFQGNKREEMYLMRSYIRRKEQP